MTDFNATQAAIRAGYGKKNAASVASRLLRNVNVSRAVAQRIQERRERIQLDEDWVLRRLVEVSERCLRPERKMEWDPEEKMLVPAFDEETGRPIFEFDSAGANRSLQLVGLHIGMWPKKTEHAVDVKVTEVQIDI